ncbi:hypothetical protein VNO77_14177 [Canavalia gladiata]|uniref:Uncharacterized protein n=1 Tax=Canavalia gladiata TaxID=3824 RepID=A0AAN9LYK0_CANGL
MRRFSRSVEVNDRPQTRESKERSLILLSGNSIFSISAETREQETKFCPSISLAERLAPISAQPCSKSALNRFQCWPIPPLSIPGPFIDLPLYHILVPTHS